MKKQSNIHPKVWTVALALAGGNHSRLSPAGDGAVLVSNAPIPDPPPAAPKRKRTRKPRP